MSLPGGRSRLHVLSTTSERDDKVRGKPEKFAEHYNQATLFWKSQSEVEQQHSFAPFASSSPKFR